MKNIHGTCAMKQIYFPLLMTLMISMYLGACESNSSSSFTTHTHPLQSPHTIQKPLFNQLHFAATSLASDLAQRSIYTSAEGSPLPIHLSKSIDGALLALHHGFVDAAIYVSSEHVIWQKHNQALGIQTWPLASSALWWATQSHAVPLNEKQWHDLLLAKVDPREPHYHLQICLRAAPDPLEQQWLHDHPQWKTVFHTMRTQKLWPVFDQEEMLMNYLKDNPQAVALMDVARLKLYALPLGQLRIQAHKTSSVQFLLSIQSQNIATHLQTYMQHWLTFIQSATYQDFIQNWGWSIYNPSK